MIEFYASGMSPLIAMVVGAMIIAGISFWVSNRVLASISAGFMLVTFALLFLILGDAIPIGQSFGGVITEDAFAVVFQLIFMAVAFLSVLYSVKYVEEDRNHGEYYSLLMLAVVGMMVVSASTDLITMFVGIALTGLSSASITAFRKHDKTGAEAAMKFYIISALSAGLALYGISLIYGLTHSLQFSAVSAALQDLQSTNPGDFGTAMLALVLLTAGFGFEIAVVPFHMWAPDVYEGSPTPVSGMLTSGSKKVGIAAVFKIFMIAMIAYRAEWGPLFAVLAILTMTVGNVAALRQDSVKRMLAYSSIGQAGYMLISLPVFAAAHSAALGATSPAAAGTYNQLAYLSISYGIFQVMTHSLATVGAFGVVAIMSTSVVGMKFDSFRGLFKSNKLLSVSMTLFLFSLLGMPLLAGFDSKLLIFSAAVGGSLISGYSWLIWLAIFGIVNSAVSLIYYVRLVRNIYSDSETPAPKYAISRFSAIAIIIAAAAVVVIGVYPGPFITACNHAAQALMSEF